ncbi:MAG: glycosyltransferase [Bauldia litoralis]
MKVGTQVFMRLLGDTRRRKLADFCSDFRHWLTDYPVDDLEPMRPRLVDDFPTASKIPRVLVQTYRTSALVRPIHGAATAWQEMNPEFDYKFFDDDEARAFIQERYPTEVLEAFDSLVPGAYRADLWRYCYLAAEGGVYADIRMEPLVALRTILDFSSDAPPDFVGVRDRPGSKGHGLAYLYNAFMAAAPGHPFLTAAVERTVRQVRAREYGRDLLDITGPGCIGAASNEALGQPIDTPFTLGDHDDPAVGRYRILEHDDDDYHRSVLTFGDQFLIRTKCIHGRMFRADRSLPSHSYSYYYFKRQVYR